jgi:protein gp37
MSDKTGIEWTDATWNPVTGCAKVSQGCKHCYAEREWPRMTKLVPAYAGRQFTDVRTHSDRLEQPLRWRKPRMIFVNSMSDLFHPDVPDAFIDHVFAIMVLAKQHTFQVLTKRPARMREYLSQRTEELSSDDWFLNAALARSVFAASKAAGDPLPGNAPLMLAGRWPLPNVWIGVSIEDQVAAGERIPLLLNTPAAVRWVSMEPLLGDVTLTDVPNVLGVAEGQRHLDALGGFAWECDGPDYVDTCNIGSRIDWVVVGGESGPKARPMHPDWARSLRDQCAAAGVPFLFKQWGEWAPRDTWIPASIKPQLAIAADGAQVDHDVAPQDVGGHRFERVGKKLAGRLLDGVQHDEYPK